MARPAAIILEYGKRPAARWRRLLRWALVAVLLVTLAFAGLFAMRNLAIWVARREGARVVTAWYRQSGTAVLPAGTLLYSERASDAALPGALPLRRRSPDGTTVTASLFDQQYPQLRQILYNARGVPVAYPNRILYVHEHPLWTVPTGSRPYLFCVGYDGLDPQGRPQFSSMANRLADPGERRPFPGMGGTTGVSDVPGRSLANLRIFAGAPHPTDATRFSLPFDCDGGGGRFEFRTDTDVTDGGKLAPDVWIEWDDAATQPATTQVGAADVVSR
jgi:hypothetical protein